MKAIVKATAKCKGGFKGYFVKNVPGICSDEIHEEIPVFGTREEANPIEFDPKTENLYELCNVNPEMTELAIEFELAKLAKPNYDGLKKYLEKINVAFEEIGEDIKVTSSQHGMYFIPKNFPDQVMKFGYGFEPTGRDKNGYCYVILTPNPVEEESKPEAPQTEVGNEPEKKVAKSKHQIGDTKFYLGITYYVAGFNAKGTPLWRVKKDTESVKA